MLSFCKTYSSYNQIASSDQDKTSRPAPCARVRVSVYRFMYYVPYPFYPLTLDRAYKCIGITSIYYGGVDLNMGGLVFLNMIHVLMRFIVPQKHAVRLFLKHSASVINILASAVDSISRVQCTCPECNHLCICVSIIQYLTGKALHLRWTRFSTEYSALVRPEKYSLPGAVTDRGCKRRRLLAQWRACCPGLP